MSRLILAARAEGPNKPSFHEFRRFGEDTVDDVRKIAIGGAVIAGIVALIFFVSQKQLDGWDFYGRPALNWALILAAVAFGVWVFQCNFRTFGTEVVSELKRVTWPSWEEAKKNTSLVLSVMLLFSVTVFVYDLVFNFIFERILKLY